MKRPFRTFAKNRSGAAMIEYAIVFSLLMLMTFGLVEFGLVFYQYNAAETATAVGARYIATRGPVYTGLPDCGVTTTAAAGTNCSAVSGADTWTRTCNASSPATGCSATMLNALVARMQQFAPSIQAQNVQVLLRGAGLGFVGRGAPVPMVTVRLTGMTYNFIALNSLLGFGTLAMPSFDATV